MSGANSVASLNVLNRQGVVASSAVGEPNVDERESEVWNDLEGFVVVANRSIVIHLLDVRDSSAEVQISELFPTVLA